MNYFLNYRIFNSLKNYLVKKNSSDERIDCEDEITHKKDIVLYEINEKKLLNFDDFKNIVNFDSKEKISLLELEELYKGKSAFCLWRSLYTGEMFSIIATLAGGLIFLKLNDGNHV